MTAGSQSEDSGNTKQLSSGESTALNINVESVRGVKKQLVKLLADEPVNVPFLLDSLASLFQKNPGKSACLTSELGLSDDLWSDEKRSAFQVLLDYAAHPNDYDVAPSASDEDAAGWLDAIKSASDDRHNWLELSHRLSSQSRLLVLCRNVWRVANERLEPLQDVTQAAVSLGQAVGEWILRPALAASVQHFAGAPRKPCAIGRQVGNGQLSIEVEIMPEQSAADTNEKWSLTVRFAKESRIRAAMVALGTEQAQTAGPFTMSADREPRFRIDPPQLHSWWLYLKWENPPSFWTEEKFELQVRKLSDEAGA